MIKNYILISLSLLISLLTGCSVHQRTPPEVGALPAAFLEKHAAIPFYQDIDRWWESFDNPMLNSLIEETLENNLNLEMAFSRLGQLKAAYQSTGASQQPYLNLGGRQAGISSSASLAVPSAKHTVSLYLQATNLTCGRN